MQTLAHYTKISFLLDRVLNINSFIKYSGTVFGVIGLIFTAYRIHDEHFRNITIPIPANRAPTPSPKPTEKANETADVRKGKAAVAAKITSASSLQKERY